jgi:hypothetical protein
VILSNDFEDNNQEQHSLVESFFLDNKDSLRFTCTCDNAVNVVVWLVKAGVRA